MHATKMCSFILTALVALVVSPSAVFGQAEAGSITGTVRDASGAVIAGATVTLKNVATGAQRTVQSGGVGQYTITGLPPGTYAI